jgi:pilus assembly protein Flp/PilA
MSDVVHTTKAEEILRSCVDRFVRDESGATAIEYGLIATFMGVGVLGGLKVLAGANSTGWSGTASQVSQAMGNN